jgi:general stress protein YciG
MTTAKKDQDQTKSTTDSNEKNKNTADQKENNEQHGKQGFASMPKEKVQEIAAEGGRHSHDNTKKEYNSN